MSRRKFNLGDIIRRINEEGESSGNQHNPDQSATSRRDHLQQVSREEPVVEAETPSVPDPTNLPRQPVFGSAQRDTRHDRPIPSGHFRAPEETLKNSLFATAEPGGVPVGSSVPPNPDPDVPTQYSPPVHQAAPTTSSSFTAQSDDEDDEEEQFDIFKYISILLRRKYIVVLVVIFAAVVSFLRYLKGDTYYIAHARLLFRPDNQEIINDRTTFRYWGDREKIFNTHLELLKSQTVLNIVARNLGDSINPFAISPMLTITQGETNGEKNDIIELSCRYRDAETARDILNELCRTYIDYRRDVNAQEITRLVSKFEFQINKLQNELTQKESALREFKETHRMIELSNETSVTITKLADMEMSLQQTQLSLLENKERLGALNKQISRQELNVVQSVTYQDPFQNRIADLELELNTLTSEYSPEHYKVKTLKQQIDNLKSATVDSITREAASKTLVKNPIRQTLLQELVNITIEKSALDAKRMAQEQIIERLNRELIKLPAMEQQFAYLQRETESILQTLKMMKNKYEEAKIRRDSEESDLKLLELARTPTRAISSVKSIHVVIGILIGLILGIALALLIEYLDQSLKEPSAVENVLGLPLLGIVPFIEADNALLEQVADLTKNILEPFRALRANLKHIAMENNLKTFIVCSAVKGEGKTTLAANLGITFALDGKKVILVDGDLRRSQAHTLFAIPKEKGLSDYLQDTLTLDEIIKPTRFDNMFVVTSGERPSNPAELLGTIRFDMFVHEVRSKADIIIFDSPALLPVSDTITMAPKIDGVLFVVRTFWTPVKAAKQALNQLRRIGSRLYGGILNGASHTGKYYPYYYGYYGYYGYYSYKYSYEDDHKKPFTFRSFGLQIEKMLKNGLNSFRFGIPRNIATLSRAGRRLTSKKTFWLLLLLFMGLTATRFFIAQYSDERVMESIMYLGMGGEEKSTDQASTAAVGNDMAFSGNHVNVVRDSGVLVSELSDLRRRVDAWYRAYSETNLREYLQFYDKKSFTFSGGGYKQWSDKAYGEFGDLGLNRKLYLDTIDYGAGDGNTRVVRLTCSIHTINGNEKEYIVTTWIAREKTWFIVGQKHPDADPFGNGKAVHEE